MRVRTRKLLGSVSQSPPGTVLCTQQIIKYLPKRKRPNGCALKMKALPLKIHNENTAFLRTAGASSACAHDAARAVCCQREGNQHREGRGQGRRLGCSGRAEGTAAPLAGGHLVPGASQPQSTGRELPGLPPATPNAAPTTSSCCSVPSWPNSLSFKRKLRYSE